MRKKLNISDWTSLTLVTIIWVGWQIQNDRERCVKTVSCMGILLFSSTKYIPSDNSTLCHAVALAAVETRRKKKKPKPKQHICTQGFKKNLLIIWCLSVRHSSKLRYFMYNTVKQCTNPANLLLTSHSLHLKRQVSTGEWYAADHEQVYTVLGNFSGGVGISLIYISMSKKDSLQWNSNVIRKNFFQNCNYLSCWHRFFFPP